MNKMIIVRTPPLLSVAEKIPMSKWQKAIER
jgi:hypothetical protein